MRLITPKQHREVELFLNAYFKSDISVSAAFINLLAEHLQFPPQDRILELEEAIRDHISDGKHVGPRSERLRQVVEPRN